MAVSCRSCASVWFILFGRIDTRGYFCLWRLSVGGHRFVGGLLLFAVIDVVDSSDDLMFGVLV